MRFKWQRQQPNPDQPKFHNFALQSKSRKRFRHMTIISCMLVVGIVVYTQRGQVLALGRTNSELGRWVEVASSIATPSNEEANQQSSQAFTSEVKMQDVRSFVFDQYFQENKSPLVGTGQIFVDACDKYGAPYDCIIVVAIARAETDLCKYYNSASYYNCWGFGGGGKYRIYFNSWQESIDRVTRVLVNNYGIQYIKDPSLMEKTFCGSEPGCTNWGERVKYHIRIIDSYPRKLGFNFNLTELN